MESGTILKGLENAVASWNVGESERYARMAVDAGIPPEDTIEKGLAKGMDRVSEMFDAGEIYLPQIVMASKAMEAALKVIEPCMERDDVRLKGVIVMGTVKGDVHSIGKNVCCAMLRGSGFKVVDVGADVSPDRFVKAVREAGADVVGGSALMTVSLPQQREMVRVFNENGTQVLTIFGGAPCTEEWVNEIGGDGYSATAGEIVGLVRGLLNDRDASGGGNPGTQVSKTID